ncbi:virulence factor [Novosphingobium sp. G106]|nr:virulence factor [Novosphingobium sp. G106]
MGSTRWRWTRVISGVIPALLLLGIGLMVLGGYFENQPFALHWPRQSDEQHPGRYPLAAVYWSGDMGMRMGTGEAIVESLRARGIPVLSVSSPALFAQQRDRAFVDRSVARSLSEALAESGAQRLAVIGSSFGADIVGSGLGRVAPELRQRIASVVLVVPATDVYFHANPLGIFYRGPAAADPDHTIPLLRGLPVTCIFATEEDGGLCRTAVMARARRIGIDDGHRMLFSHGPLTAAVDTAVLNPPAPLR